ncbi:MAG: T9SS type A sorting domain-containing protein [bacterium]
MKKTILLICCFIIGINILLSKEPIGKNSLLKKEQVGTMTSKTERLIFQAEHEFNKTRDPKINALPLNIKERELKFVNSIPSKEDYYSMKKVGADKPNIQTQTWKQRGPWHYGGRFLCIAFDVENKNIINAGAASGGMWHSIDAGNSWMKTTPPNAIQSVGCVVQDKRQGMTNTWYYGTGELLSTIDRKFTRSMRMLSIGNGIYKSTDNGASWNILESTRFNVPTTLTNPFQGVWNIVVDNNNNDEDVVYAACFGGIMRSTDGGGSWTRVLGDGQNMSFSSDIIKTSDGIFYASLSEITINGNEPSQFGIFRSTDGINWNNITPQSFMENTRVIKLALAPSNENVLYILTEKPNPTDDYISFSSSSHGFWKYTYSEQSGIKWENRSFFLPTWTAKTWDYSTLGAYCMTLKVKPDDENTVILGGTCLYRSTNGFESSDSTSQIGGYIPPGSWDATNQYCHPDIHGLAFLPSNPDCLFVTNDGGVHKTNNCMADEVSWTSMNNGLLGSQFYSVSLDHASTDDFLYGGLQDNSTMFTFTDDLKTPWTCIQAGDGFATCVADNKKFILGSYQYGGIVSSRFDDDNNSIDVFYQRPDLLTASNFDFFNIFVLDPNDNKTFYIPKKNQIWRKTDMDASTIDSNFRNSGWSGLTNAWLPIEESITAISVSKVPANRLYFGSSKGNVYRLDDANTGNPIPIQLINLEFPINGFVACIEIDPHNADNLFVIFSNYNVQSIFHSTDGGASWVIEGGNLEENPDGSGAGPSIRWLKMLHTPEGPIYFVGTSTGLYSTLNLAGVQTVWVKEGANSIGNIIVDMVEARELDGTVAVATQGAGIFTTKVVYSGIHDKKNDNYSFSLEQNFPNHAKTSTQIKFSISNDEFINIKLYDINGNEIRTIEEGYFKSGIHEVKINTIDLVPGAYFYCLTSEEGKITKKMTVIR